MNSGIESPRFNSPASEAHLVLQRKGLTQGDRWLPGLLDWGVFLVTQGKAVLVGDRLRLALAAGEAVAVPSGPAGLVFEGRSEPARLDFFLVSLDLLTGVLTWAERLRLQRAGERVAKPFRHVGSSEPTAIELNRIRCRGSDGNTPLLRCELLRLFARIVSDDLDSRGEISPAWATADERVARLLREFPEATLLNQTTSELARRCGCSRRHFNRLFRDRCGVSVRTRKVELRLARAGRLLRESNAKVIQVAMESGFQHLGLFNTMFKRRFGMTPSEWRRENRLSGAR